MASSDDVERAEEKDVFTRRQSTGDLNEGQPWETASIYSRLGTAQRVQGREGTGGVETTTTTATRGERERGRPGKQASNAAAKEREREREG